MFGDFFLLPYQDESGFWWYISPWSGSLIRSPSKPALNKIPKKIISAIESCNNPYECQWNPEKQTTDLKTHSLLTANKFDKRFFLLGNSLFYFSVLYSKIHRPIVSSSKEAFSLISELPSHRDSIADKCLQRSLLAAKISASFPSSGVIFIGAEISSGEMHAWIIENNCQPDFEDRSWINYRPLLAITRV